MKLRRPTPFNLPYRIDGWLTDRSRWYRLRYYTPTPTEQFDGEA